MNAECERCGCELPDDGEIHTLRGYEFCPDCFAADQREEAEMREMAEDDRAHAIMERRRGL